MVDLGDHRVGAGSNAGNIVEPFDNREFPRRAGQIERARENPSGLNAQLPPVAGAGQGDVADVVFQIEILVLDPVWVIEIERHPHQPLSHGLLKPRPGVYRMLDARGDVLYVGKAGRSRTG
jgi:hypothetical protein